MEMILSTMSAFLDTPDSLMDSRFARERNLGTLQVNKWRHKHWRSSSMQYLEANKLSSRLSSLHTLVLDEHVNSVRRRIDSYATEGTGVSSFATLLPTVAVLAQYSESSVIQT